MVDNNFFDSLCAVNITVISGVRPSGRRVEQKQCGRKSCGILYIWDGEARFYDECGETVVASDGALLFLPKYKRYSMTYTAPSTTFVLVNFDLFVENREEIALFDDITLLAKSDESNRFAKIMMQFETCAVAKTTGAILRKNELLYRLLGAIYTLAPELSHEHEIDSRIFDGVMLLEQSYLENLPISDFAKASHVSLNTFRRLFKNQFGLSPVKYRNRLRIERAKELLSEGGFTISEVAYQSGFENVEYFCRCYREITGESPGEYKKKNLQTLL